MKGKTTKGLLQKIAMVVLAVAGVVVFIYGLSQPTAKAQEGGSDPAKKCECSDCGECYTCDSDCHCVHVDDKCCGVTCTNPCAPTCVDGVCQAKCASPLACCNGTCYDPRQCLTCSNGTVVTTCTDPCYPTCDGAGHCVAKTCNTNGCEICSDGVCSNVCNNPAACLMCDGFGSCSNTCPPGTTCNAYTVTALQWDPPSVSANKNPNDSSSSASAGADPGGALIAGVAISPVVEQHQATASASQSGYVKILWCGTNAPPAHYTATVTGQGDAAGAAWGVWSCEGSASWSVSAPAGNANNGCIATWPPLPGCGSITPISLISSPPVAFSGPITLNVVRGVNADATATGGEASGTAKAGVSLTVSITVP